MTDCYQRLVPVLPIANINAHYTENVFMDQCVIPIDIPANLLNDNRPEIVSKLITTSCELTEVKYIKKLVPLAKKKENWVV